MGLRSGEVLHGRAEGFGRKKAHVDLHAAAQTKADFIFAAGDDFHEAGKFDDVLNQLPGGRPSVAAGFAGDQDVEIADGFASAAQRASGRYFFDAREILEVLNDFFGFAFGRVDQEASGDAAVVFDGFKQLLLRASRPCAAARESFLRGPVSPRHRDH